MRTNSRHVLWTHQFEPLDEFPNNNNVQLHLEVIGWTSQRLRILLRQVHCQGAHANPFGLLEQLWTAPIQAGMIGNWKSSRMNSKMVPTSSKSAEDHRSVSYTHLTLPTTPYV